MNLWGKWYHFRAVHQNKPDTNTTSQQPMKAACGIDSML
jgi:hypothetical protein